MSISVLSTESIIPSAVKMRRPKRQTAVRKRYEARFYPSSNTQYAPLDNIRIDVSSTSAWCLPATAVLHMRIKQNGILQDAAANPSPLQAICFDCGGIGVIDRVRTSVQSLLLEDSGQGLNSLVATQIHHTASKSHYDGVETVMTQQSKYATNGFEARPFPTVAIAPTAAIINAMALNQFQNDLAQSCAQFAFGQRKSVVGKLHQAGVEVAIPLAHLCSFNRTNQAFMLRSVGSVQYDISLASYLQAITATNLTIYNADGTNTVYDQIGGNQTYEIDNVYITMDLLDMNPVLLQSFDTLFRSANPGDEAIIVYDTWQVFRQNKPLSVGSDTINSYTFNYATQSLKNIVIKTQRQNTMNNIRSFSIGGSENLVSAANQPPLSVTQPRPSQGIRLQIGGVYYPNPNQIGGSSSQFGGIAAVMAQNRKALGLLGDTGAGALVGYQGMARGSDNDGHNEGDWATFFNFEAMNESEHFELDGLDTTLNSQIQIDLEQGIPAGQAATDCVVTIGIESSKYLLLHNNTVKISA